jgi:hypothetical protein
MKNVNHYLKDGTKWSGTTHKAGGKAMTGKTHTATSKPLFHLKDLGVQTKSKKK